MKWTQPSSTRVSREAQWVVLRAQPTRIVRKKGGAVMRSTTLEIDLAKNVFQ